MAKLTLRDIKRSKGLYYFPDVKYKGYLKEEAIDILYMNNWLGEDKPRATVSAKLFKKIITEIEGLKK